MCRLPTCLIAVAMMLWFSEATLAQPFTNVTVPLGISQIAPIPGDHHGPGALFVDLNLDGYPEIYICRGDPLGGPAPSPNELYLNIPNPAGPGRIYQLLTLTGAEDNGDATGAIAADYDNDGDVDIYVINFDSPNTLLRNELVPTGGLGFTDVTLATDPTPGVVDGQFGVGWAIDPLSGILLDNSLTASFFDANRDGWVDLYVGNHNGYAPFVTIEGPDQRPGRRDVFYLNNGNGTFTEVTTTLPGTPLTGFETPAGLGMTANQRYSSTNAVVAFDANNDRWPDLYVTNKVGGPDDADMLYLNQGMSGGVWQGFQNGSYVAGGGFATSSPAAMGVAVGDWNNDLIFDAYVADLGPNELHTGTLAGAQPIYITTSAPPLGSVFSWGTEFFDFDNDGLVDIYVGANSTAQADELLWNTPSGVFQINVQAGLIGPTMTNDTRGVMTADFNKDGWVDVFTVPMLAGSPTVLQNNMAVIFSQNNWLHIRLIGDPTTPGPLRSSADAIGGRAVVSADLNGDGVVGVGENMMREVVSGSSNAGSTSSLKLEFGVGLAATVSVRVLWPSGQTSGFQNIAVNQCLTVMETGGLGPPC
ncbi:MAG: hypothetical protein Tsb002_14700 [Wenzhouxiangellaceae bacterium]